PLAVRFNDTDAKKIAGIPDSLLQAEEELRQDIRFYLTESLKEKSKKDGYDTLKVTRYETKHFASSRKLDSLIAFFETSFSDYYKLKYDNHTASVQEIQQNLDENTALVNYLVSDSSLFMAVVTNTTYSLEEVKTGPTFKNEVTEYYKSIKTADPESFTKLSHELYKKLIVPVNKHIKGKTRLVIIPDDMLYYVPFETLITRAPSGTGTPYSSLDYLINTYEITYHQSATLWAGATQKDRSGNELSFLGFAPVFDGEGSNGLIARQNKKIVDTTYHHLDYRSVTSDLEHFNPLPWSKDEVISISELFAQQNIPAKAYLYNEANEVNFKNNAADYSILHVSSHGFANDKEPVLSGIVFSQSDDSLSLEDGILYAGETIT
ncbi:MAG: CHAT domain-containing protein, partial [Bacteroidales bacterium]|nr:CHAT domain-containing protein [Bacteroidales bacterium]